MTPLIILQEEHQQILGGIFTPDECQLPRNPCGGCGSQTRAKEWLQEGLGNRSGKVPKEDFDRIQPPALAHQVDHLVSKVHPAETDASPVTRPNNPRTLRLLSRNSDVRFQGLGYEARPGFSA
jgi:hypothetical protein